MAYRLHILTEPMKIMTNYYELAPIWALCVADFAWMGFSIVYNGWNNDSHIMGKIPPNERISLLDVTWNRKLWTINQCFEPLPELHKIYTEMGEKEREYNRMKPAE